MKKIFFKSIVFSLFCVSIMILCACQGKQKRGNEKINVGVIVPLTGQLAYTGDFVKEALLMSVDTSKVNLIFEDSKGTTKDGVSATNTAIQKGADVIVSMTSFIAEAINPICEQRNITHFAFAFSPALAEKTNVLENFPSSTAEANEYINYIDSMRVKNVCFMRHIEPDADWGYNKIIKPALESKNVDIINEPFQPDNLDFKNNMLRIKNTNPDLLIVQSYAYHFPNIINYYKTLSIKTPILCDLNYIDVFSFGYDVVKNLEDIPFLGVDFVVSDAYGQYSKSYQKLYNKVPYAYSAYAYDLGHFFNQLAENKVPLNKQDIIRFNLEHPTDGICGQFAYSSQGVIETNYCVLKIHDGEYVKY